MLVLTRMVNEGLRIGDDIEVRVVRIDGKRVGLGIDAPKDVRILRSEIAREEGDDDGGRTVRRDA